MADFSATTRKLGKRARSPQNRWDGAGVNVPELKAYRNLGNKILFQ